MLLTSRNLGWLVHCVVQLPDMITLHLGTWVAYIYCPKCLRFKRLIHSLTLRTTQWTSHHFEEWLVKTCSSSIFQHSLVKCTDSMELNGGGGGGKKEGLPHRNAHTWQSWWPDTGGRPSPGTRVRQPPRTAEAPCCIQSAAAPRGPRSRGPVTRPLPASQSPRCRSPTVGPPANFMSKYMLGG